MADTTARLVGDRCCAPLGLHPAKDHASVYTEDELRRLVDISRQSGQLELEEQQLIHKVFKFSDSEVREAMVPCTQVKALPANATLEDVRTAFLSSGYSRLPVYGERLDEIIGSTKQKKNDAQRDFEQCLKHARVRESWFSRPPSAVRPRVMQSNFGR